MDVNLCTNFTTLYHFITNIKNHSSKLHLFLNIYKWSLALFIYSSNQKY
jgi:hypothetical protein